MAENESSVIEHLIEVETQASSVTQAAQDEASKKINSAKAQAEQDYLSRFNKEVAALEKDYEAEASKIKNEQTEQIASYKKSISASAQDKAGFNKLLDSVLAK